MFSTSFFQSAAYRLVLGLRVAEDQHVAELHRRFAVVLRKLVGVELRERPRQPTLYARGKRLLLFLPVERHELAEFVGGWITPSSVSATSGPAPLRRASSRVRKSGA